MMLPESMKIFLIKMKKFLNNKFIRIIIAGGDGSVSFIIDEMQK